MFDPTRDQVREAFFEAWRKYRAGELLAGIDALIVEVALAHPEYHGVLSDPDRYRGKDYVDEGNPFLHMSLHLALEEQLSIDQPPGIAAAFRRRLSRSVDRHEALHHALECLAETVWKSQRDKASPDADAYLRCIEKA